MSFIDRTKNNQELLDKILRIVNISNKPLSPTKDNSYNPVLAKGDIVQCEFIGIGKELDDTHFAIVWVAKANESTVNIIPLTSQSKDESNEVFNLGKINNFMTLDKCTSTLVNKPSYVYINKMLQVSRKRIKQYFQKDATGALITTNKKNKTVYCPVTLSPEQLNRIEEGLLLYYTNTQHSLCDYICNKENVSYLCDPHLDPRILDLGYRIPTNITTYNLDTNTRLLIFFIDKTRYSLKLFKMDNNAWNIYKSPAHKKLYNLIKYNNSAITRRTLIIQSLFSRNQPKVNEAQSLIKNILSIP